MNISIRPEESRDHQAVESLTREAFWDLYRPGCSEHWIVHEIRKAPSFVKALSYVACDGDTVVGNIIYSKAKVVHDEKGDFEVLCMGPFAVLPSFQKKGIGALLMDHSIQKAKELGFQAVIIFGDPRYYRRFGFVNAKEHSITTSTGENFDAFLALELSDKALESIHGRFFADPVFEVNAEAVEAFDQGFPHKEKHITGTQLFH